MRITQFFSIGLIFESLDKKNMFKAQLKTQFLQLMDSLKLEILKYIDQEFTFHISLQKFIDHE